MMARPVAPVRGTSPQRRQLILAGGLALCGVARGQPPAAFWSLLRQGGCVVLLRHAQTEPGLGDPPGFRLGNCTSQRNLSEAGRAQASQLGQAFARERVPVAEVRSSAWCRCIDTAQLAFGRHTVWPAINSFFGDSAVEAIRTAEVLAALRDMAGPGNLVLVTHQVNMTALTGEYPAMGEVFVTRRNPAMPARLQLLERAVP